MTKLSLFPFQKEAVDKLNDIRSVLIGDDMGLGKTVTAIALDVERRKKLDQPVKTLVVCPLSVVSGSDSSWTEHFRKWAPHLSVMPINNKNREPFMEAVEAGYFDVYICHWPMLRLEPELEKYPWFHVIGDEAHNLQNRKSAQTKALKKIKSMYKTGLTGTPVFNKPDDLWSILNWLYPKFWSSYWSYFKRYIEWADWNGYKQVVGVKNEEELMSQMRPFYIRRRKAEVLKDLPDKYYSTIKVELHSKQRKAYDAMKKDMIAWVGEHEHEPINAPIVIAQLMRLQQFACAYARLEHIGPHPQGARADFQEEVRTKVFLDDPSSKLDAVLNIVQSTDLPIVVFSQFSQMINLLGARLEKAGISHGIYTGSVKKTERDRIVDNFQNNKLRVFAGTIKAGGVALTLTNSNTVIFTDRDWAQSLNIQAEDRLHRIGQKNATQVIDIVADDTLDAERLDGIAMNWAVVKQLLGEL